ncbi:Smr/MutS family protein [bacterium]|nr:Smr/MutS family protein [bacterium]
MDNTERDRPGEDLPAPIVVRDILDLHGFFPEQIPEIMDAFIENALDIHCYELRVIHGKGKSRLKFEVREYLKTDMRIASFVDAAPHLGGWGATIIYLLH